MGSLPFFSQNQLLWQRPLRYRKRGPDRSSAPKTLSFGEKIAKITPADPEIICLCGSAYFVEYLQIYLTDFRNLFTIWKHCMCRWWICTLPYFPICQGTLPWQPNNIAVMKANWDLLQWLSGLGLLELQCSESGWLVRQGVGSSPTPASMSSQVSACYEIKFSGQVQRVACVLFKLWQAITPRSGASGVWWEPPVWITDGRGQQSYRKTAYWHPARETHRLS